MLSDLFQKEIPSIKDNSSAFSWISVTSTWQIRHVSYKWNKVMQHANFTLPCLKMIFDTILSHPVTPVWGNASIVSLKSQAPHITRQSLRFRIAHSSSAHRPVLSFKRIFKQLFQMCLDCLIMRMADSQRDLQEQYQTDNSSAIFS